MSMFGAVDLSSLAPSSPAPGAAGAAGVPGGAGGSAAGSAAMAGAAGAAEGPVLPAPLVVDVTVQNLQDIAQVSTQLPVIIVVSSQRSEAAQSLATLLERLAWEYGGRFELGVVDGDASPEVAQALQVSAVPTALALMAGQPMLLFQGAMEETQLRSLIDQVLEVAAQNGLRGRLAMGEEPEVAPEPEETELERTAREAVERGDFEAALKAYDHAIAQEPGNRDLPIARAQIHMLQRMDGQDPRALLLAAERPEASVEDMLAGADAALALGDIAGTLERALQAVRVSSGEDREAARLRILELFNVIGPTAPEVAQARRTLGTLLY